MASLSARLLALLLLVMPVAVVAADTWKVSVVKAVSYETPNGPRKMDIYLPMIPEQAQGVPCVIWLGQKTPSARDESVCADLAGAGFVAAKIDYEPDDKPSDQPVLSGKCAVRFLRASAAKFHIDERQIAIMGASHAGTYALLIGLTRNEPRFAVKDAVYPGVSDRVGVVVTLSARTDWRVPEVKSWPDWALEELRVLSPVTCVTADAPPILMFHGTRDKIVSDDNATNFEKLLTRYSVPHRLVWLTGVGHTYLLTTANRRALPENVKGICVAFLRQHLAASK